MVEVNIRELSEQDSKQFSDLIIDMYAHLENLEWFSPMPYDEEAVRQIIANPRFYIIGAFAGSKLVGVASLDYKCGKLIGKIDFPVGYDTEKLVEIGFSMVHSEYRGNKIQQKLIDYLLAKIKDKGFKFVFAKIHKDNIASNKSCLNKGFTIWKEYAKPVKRDEFIALSSQEFFSKVGKENSVKTLNKFKDGDIIVNYNILVREI